MWSLTRFVRHSGLPQKAAVPPLSPVWPIARILAWGQACVSSRSPDLNKKNLTLPSQSSPPSADTQARDIARQERLRQLRRPCREAAGLRLWCPMCGTPQMITTSLTLPTFHVPAHLKKTFCSCTVKIARSAGAQQPQRNWRRFHPPSMPALANSFFFVRLFGVSDQWRVNPRCACRSEII